MRPTLNACASVLMLLTANSAFAGPAHAGPCNDLSGYYGKRTAIVVGQDGSSRAPRARNRTGGAEPGEESASSFAVAFDAIDRLQPSVNVASMIGLGSVRAAVVGEADRHSQHLQSVGGRALSVAGHVSAKCVGIASEDQSDTSKHPGNDGSTPSGITVGSSDSGVTCRTKRSHD